MIRVTRVGESGAELATIELDDFTVEILYSGIAQLLRDAVTAQQPAPPPTELSKEARSRRERVLARILA